MFLSPSSLSLPGHRPALDGGACSTRDGGAGGRQEGARELQVGAHLLKVEGFKNNAMEISDQPNLRCS